MRRGLALLFVALVMVGGSQAYLHHRGPLRSGGQRLLYLPNGNMLRVAALGYPSFFADLIYIWSIQHYAGYRGEDRFRYLEHVYNEVIAGLDPDFVEPYLVGALILVAEKRDVEAGLDLLDRGIEANPDEWILPYQAGFWAYDTARDYPRAARYFEIAMRIPGSPPSTRRLHAEMFNKVGDKTTSLNLWQEVLAGASDEKVQGIAAKHVHDLTIDVDLERLHAAIESYRQRHGAFPARLDDLTRDGRLAEIPLDPDGNPYAYDARTGEASSSAPFRLRRPR